LKLLEVCPLCCASDCNDYWQDSRRNFYQCSACALVFVGAAQHLSAEQEKAEYDKHQNLPDDKGYKLFLSRVYQPMLAKIKLGDQGLDFGCGPGPVLSTLFEQAGFPVAIYDPYYFDDKQALSSRYDFITATEVIEHIYQPNEVLPKLWSLLENGGTLGLMTKLVKDQQAFGQWHYKNDLTHVCFYSRNTFTWLAAELGAELEFVGDDVILLCKPSLE
jgi:2-polyprenyl-3-methyl-5-hydroxy-6-metoxy-1,4-benzoquinol methylase